MNKSFILALCFQGWSGIGNKYQGMVLSEMVYSFIFLYIFKGLWQVVYYEPNVN